MKLAILGTRGIPNNHGGFEQFAEYFSIYLSQRDVDVFVYNSHHNPYRDKTYKNVNIIHCFDPEKNIGSIGQFIYDLNCILDSRGRNFDIILQLGYTSSTIWHWLISKKSLVVTNMDGLEWKRTKYSRLTSKFLKFAEKLAVKHSDFLISDSIGIKKYLKFKYNVESKYIAYGTEIFNAPEKNIIKKYNVEAYNYSLIIARLEPENSIEVILDGYYKSKTTSPILIFGKINLFGRRLIKKYKDDSRIKFLGANYCISELNNLRYYSRYYFHGHTVGGTNPSLLEAMSSKALIVAHKNIFNISVLGEGGLYFETSNDITIIVNEDNYFRLKDINWDINKLKIKNNFTWEIINNAYEHYLKSIL